MSRRVRLPGADELFRPTQPGGAEDADRAPVAEPVTVGAGVPSANGAAPSGAVPDQKRGPSGRVRHDEKITVYVTADELLDLEHTRLALRRDHGLAVDRGRIVREAIHLALESVASDGGDSELVRRLSDA